MKHNIFLQALIGTLASCHTLGQLSLHPTKICFCSTSCPMALYFEELQFVSLLKKVESLDLWSSHSPELCFTYLWACSLGGYSLYKQLLVFLISSLGLLYPRDLCLCFIIEIFSVRYLTFSFICFTTIGGIKHSVG